MHDEKNEELQAKFPKTESWKFFREIKKLPQDEIERRLNAIIDAESALPEAEQDPELVNACIDLQWYLGTGEHYSSNLEAARRKLDSKLSESAAEPDAPARRRRRPLAIVAAVVCLSALLIAVPVMWQSLAGRERISGETIAGGEIYRLNGEEVDAGLMREAIAENEHEDISIETSDYDMLAQIQTVRDMHPQYIPEGWRSYSFNYTCTEDTVYYVEKYRKDGEKKELFYKCVVYPDADSVVDSMQQNESGSVSVIGGRNVYLAENYDMVLATWSDGLNSYSISAPFDYEEIVQIINSIKGD